MYVQQDKAFQKVILQISTSVCGGGGRLGLAENTLGAVQSRPHGLTIGPDERPARRRAHGHGGQVGVRVGRRGGYTILEEYEVGEAHALENDVQLLPEQVRHGRVEEEVDGEVEVANHERHVLDSIAHHLIDVDATFLADIVVIRRRIS